MRLTCGVSVNRLQKHEVPKGWIGLLDVLNTALLKPHTNIKG